MIKSKSEFLAGKPAVSLQDTKHFFSQLNHIFVFLVALFILSPFGITAASAQDFDAEYAQLKGKFKASFNSRNSLEALVEEADKLHDKIREYRKDKRADLSKEQRKSLRKLYRQVKKFEMLTKTVGQLKNMAKVRVKDFALLSEQLDIKPQVVKALDSGLELVRIDIDSFASILLHNPTKKAYSVMYSVNDSAKPGGVGIVPCESYAVLSGLFNSRDREIENLDFTFNFRESKAAKCK